MTTPLSQIEVVSNPRPDTDASAENVRHHPRGRDKEISRRGGNFRLIIIDLEGKLAAAEERIGQLQRDLDRSRATSTRLSEHTGLCAQLRADVHTRDGWLTEWRQHCATLQAEAITTRTDFERRLAEGRATIEHLEERHLELSGGLTALTVANGGLQAEVASAQAQRDAHGAQLTRAKRALRHSVRDGYKLAQDLIVTGARLVGVQSELLGKGTAIMDLQRRLLPAEPITSAEDSVSSSSSLRRLFDGQSLAPASSQMEPDPWSPPVSRSSTPCLSPAPDPDRLCAPDGAALLTDLDPPDSLASLLLRNPGADITGLLITGEPATPDSICADFGNLLESVFGNSDAAHLAVPNLSPNHSVSGDGLGSFDPASPRPDGATSPADPRSRSRSPSFSWPIGP